MLSIIRRGLATIGPLNVVVGVAVFVLIIKCVPILSEDTMIAIAGVLATVAGILSGFSLAAITMLVGMTGNKVIRTLRSNGMLGQLLDTLNINSVLLVIVSVLSLASMMLGSFSIEISGVKYNPDWILLCVCLSMMVTLVGCFMSSWKKISLIIGVLSKM